MSVSVYRQAGLRPDPHRIRRFLGCRDETDAAFSSLIDEAAQAVSRGSYRVCWVRLPVSIHGDALHFGDALCVTSASLAAHLAGCTEAVLFCASLGSAVDRAILAHRLRPAQALVWDAVGSDAIEQLCDDFCDTLPKPRRSRFSPGYGDLDLGTQAPLLRLLDAERLLGVGLTDSLLMTPTKSVTAIVGLESRG